MMGRLARWAVVQWPILREVRVLRWLQEHQCMVCGKPTKRRGSHWPCESSLL